MLIPLFTQIFNSLTWHNSSGPCTRGPATCTTWLLGGSAARITQIDKDFANNTVNWLKTYEDTLLAYYCADNNNSVFYSSFIVKYVTANDCNRLHLFGVLLRI